jgi:hypothetical protein
LDKLKTTSNSWLKSHLWICKRELAKIVLVEGV